MTKNKKVGLALSCGGWRSLSYVGVIKELERVGVEIDVVVGSSGRTLIGGMHAVGKDIDEIDKGDLTIGVRVVVENKEKIKKLCL